MHIKVRCVFEEYQILKKLCQSNKKQWSKLWKPYSFWVYAKNAHLFVYLCFLRNFEQAFSWGPERKSLWSKYIGEICVIVVYIKITFPRLILNWRSLCKLSRDAMYIRKYTAKSAEHMTCSERVQNMFKMCSWCVQRAINFIRTSLEHVLNT